MKLMVSKAVLLSIAAIGISFTNPSPKGKSYTLIAEEGHYQIEADHTYLIVPTKLMNNTDDTLKYALMSCPKNSGYSVDSKELHWGEPRIDCNGTVPLILKILPHQGAEKNIRLELADSFKGTQISYRISFNLFDNPQKYFKNDDGIFNKRIENKPKKLWSNLIKMDVPK